MCNSLLNQIKLAQKTKGTELLDIIEKFKPLVCKYAGLLINEDAKNDLECHLIDVLLKIDASGFSESGDNALIAYIKRSLYHRYIYLSKRENREQKLTPFSSLNKRDLAIMERNSSISNPTDDLMISEISKWLNKKEFEIIYMHYIIGIPISQIARNFSCSRQSINQTKNRALKKLREHISK